MFFKKQLQVPHLELPENVTQNENRTKSHQLGLNYNFPLMTSPLLMMEPFQSWNAVRPNQGAAINGKSKMTDEETCIKPF